MKNSQFLDELKDMNANTWGYGNEILYCMAKDPLDLKSPDKRSGAIWLIGRAYAASPQRRSYGKTKNGEKYKNFDGQEVIRPIWPVRTQNDGREGFFDEIGKNIDISCLKWLIKNCNKLDYQFDYLTDSNTMSDIELLKNTITAVLDFNKSLSKAIETFDEVDALKDRTFEGERVACNNHISFASKFLHFYFPKLVFIIDNFAYNGGCFLFNGSENKSKRRYLRTPPTENEYFEQEIYDDLPQANVVKEIIKRITNSMFENSTAVEQEYNTIEGDNQLEGKHYIEHCVRSYLMGCYLKKNGIAPISQIKYSKPLEIHSMPRLTDTIFLNVKKYPSSKEIKYQESLKSTYYQRIKQQKICRAADE